MHFKITGYLTGFEALIMLVTKNCFIFMVAGIILFHKDAVCSVTWYFYHSGSESSQGRLGRMSVPSMSHCAVECFVHTQCQIFGYETAAGACYLHDGSFSSTSDSSSHASVRYFRATAKEATDYEYIKSVDKYILYVDDQMVWEDAKTFCEHTGGHLIYVNTQSVLDYISDQRETVHTKYWVGGIQINGSDNSFMWLSGDILDSENGGQFWINIRRDQDAKPGELVCVETVYSAGKDRFGLNDRVCSNTRKFFCEKE